MERRGVTPTVVATVGTTHSLAFAGLPFACTTIVAQGLRPVCVVAGVTAQDGAGVLARHAVPPEIIAAQFRSLAHAEVAALHIGALLDAPTVVAVADALAAFPDVPVVLDPVFATGGGDRLADAAAQDALREHLVPRTTLVTPNLAEAAALCGFPVDDLDAMERAGAALVARGARAALIKGGHRVEDATDVLVDDDGAHHLRGARVAGDMRGTGDLLAVLAACSFARGAPLHEAVAHARHAVREAIARAEPFAGTRVCRI